MTRQACAHIDRGGLHRHRARKRCSGASRSLGSRGARAAPAAVDCWDGRSPTLETCCATAFVMACRVAGVSVVALTPVSASVMLIPASAYGAPSGAAAAAEGGCGCPHAELNAGAGATPCST